MIYNLITLVVFEIMLNITIFWLFRRLAYSLEKIYEIIYFVKENMIEYILWLFGKLVNM